MPYVLGNKSRQKLQGVHPDLVAVVERAIEISEQDFSVGEGLRSIDRQHELYNTGRSKTLNSRHLTGHAVDLFPYPISWDWKYFYPIADAMKAAAEELDIPLEWGGAWHISPFYDWEGPSQLAHENYIEVRRSQGAKPFGDAPHFQLSRGVYP